MNSTAYRGIGLMCGTSHDALDVADVEFTGSESNPYVLHSTKAFPLPNGIRDQLDRADQLTGVELMRLDTSFATFCATCIKSFIKDTDSNATFIASHGVTVFHQPNNGFTTQIGSGAIMASLINMPVVSDFRQQDVTLGGQGAPLVPFCDQHLFSNYDCTLNLGGFANISLLKPTNAGYDICACNLLLNYFCRQHGLDYDHNGDLARKGEVIPSFLQELNDQTYFERPPPKSLGVEWIHDHLNKILIQNSKHNLEHVLCTCVEHIALQIGRQLKISGQCLVTGGGALNGYLIDRIQAHANIKIMVPEPNLINFKEALCFAFLGYRRLHELVNVDPSVTGSSRVISAGSVYLP